MRPPWSTGANDPVNVARPANPLADFCVLRFLLDQASLLTTAPSNTATAMLTSGVGSAIHPCGRPSELVRPPSWARG